MKIWILLILLIPILIWIAFIIAIFEEALKMIKNNPFEASLSLGLGTLMAYGLYEFLLKIINLG